MQTINTNGILKKFSGLFLLLFMLLTSTYSALAANLSGFVQTANGTPVCALALASGRSMFTCSPIGEFNFTDLPLESNGTITLQVYADGFYPNVTSLSDFSPQQVVMKPAQICEGGGGGGTNKQKTESLIGSWHFTFTIMNTFDEYFSLSGPAVPFDAYPGNYLVLGTDSNGNADVAAGYNDTVGKYTLVDVGASVFDEFYVFDYNSANTITGCYYQQIKATGSISSCYPLNGSKITSVLAANAPLKKVFAPSSEIESQKVEEVEALSMARASLSISSVATKEDISKQAEVEKLLWQLKEAIQTR